MTAARLPDGSVAYRGLSVVLNSHVRPSKLGRYTVEGIPFCQLAHAKEYIDILHKQGLAEAEELV